MTLPFLQAPEAPIAGRADTDISTPEDETYPVTYTPSAVVDAWGLYSLVDEEGAESVWSDDVGSEPNIGLAGGTQSQLLAGLRNADFARPPPDAGRPIDDDNPLPGWSFTSAQGNIEASWTEDGIVWSVPRDVAQDDLAYIEQVIPLSGLEGVMAPRILAEPVDLDGSWRPSWYRSYQCYRADGTTTGPAETNSGWPMEHTSAVLTDPSNGLVNGQSAVPVPDDARYLRVRFGVIGEWLLPPSPTQAQSGLVRSIRVREAAPVYHTLTLTADSLPATGTDFLNLEGSGGAGRFHVPALGWVASVSVRLGSARTSGTIAFYVYEQTLAEERGPGAVINGSWPSGRAATGALSATNRLAMFDLIRARARVTSGTFAPTSQNVVMVVTIATLPNCT